MPGHAHAAIKAMDAKFENLSSNGYLKEAEMYRLSDENDESKYLSAQYFKDNSINPCLESRFSTVVSSLLRSFTSVEMKFRWGPGPGHSRAKYWQRNWDLISLVNI